VTFCGNSQDAASVVPFLPSLVRTSPRVRSGLYDCAIEECGAHPGQTQITATESSLGNEAQIADLRFKTCDLEFAL
jgi:hypothetical protein